MADLSNNSMIRTNSKKDSIESERRIQLCLNYLGEAKPLTPSEFDIAITGPMLTLNARRGGNLVTIGFLFFERMRLGGKIEGKTPRIVATEIAIQKTNLSPELGMLGLATILTGIGEMNGILYDIDEQPVPHFLRVNTHSRFLVHLGPFHPANHEGYIVEQPEILTDGQGHLYRGVYTLEDLPNELLEHRQPQLAEQLVDFRETRQIGRIS